MFYSYFYLIRCKEQSKKNGVYFVYSQFFWTVPVLVEVTGQGYLPERVQTFCEQFLFLDNIKKIGKVNLTKFQLWVGVCDDVTWCPPGFCEIVTFN